MVQSRSRQQGTDEDIDRDVRIVSARQLLSQIYYRQNMYVLAAQDLDGEDMLRYLVPSVIFTGISAFLGFCGSSAMVENDMALRSTISLMCGFMGVLATTVTALRNASKFDVKAEMFRGAASQYRLLATRIEERIRQYTLMSHDERIQERPLWAAFFEEQSKTIMTCQSEMKYFPPGSKVSRWIEQGKMSPNPVDQPGILAINGDEAALRIRMMSGDSAGGGWAAPPPAPKVEGAVVP